MKGLSKILLEGRVEDAQRYFETLLGLGLMQKGMN